MKGLIHVYCGDGKGKTTAAMGLAVRAAGTGMKVVLTQFMKGDTSGEIKILRSLPGVTVMHCHRNFGFVWNMNDVQKQEAAAAYTELFDKVTAMAVEQKAEVLIMDEFMSAYNVGFLDKQKALDFLANKPEGLEVALTGRDPAPEIQELADYITEMRKIKHPFDKGINARKGIED